MKTLTFENRKDWLDARFGRITGSTLKKIISRGGGTKEMMFKVLDSYNIPYKPSMKKDELEMLLTPVMKGEIQAQLPKKVGFWELLAQRLGIEPDEAMGYETPMDRGTKLEPFAIAAFEENTGMVLDQSLVIWTRDDDKNIAVSPDAFKDNNIALEAKCLNSAHHIEAYVKKFIWAWSDFEAVPDDYKEQIVQYFIVNDELTTLYMAFHDPRVVAKNFFYLTITRDAVKDDVDNFLAQERNITKELDDLVNKITF